MKKFFSLLLSFAAVALFAADYQFPGWKCTDQAKLAAAAAAAPNAHAKAQIAVLQKLATKPAASFEELCAVIDEVVNSSELTWKEAVSVQFKKQFPFSMNTFIREAWEFCMKNPSYYDIYYVIHKESVLNLSAVQRYLALRDNLLKYRMSASVARMALDAFFDAAVLADGTDGISVKTDLQKMNRKFSKNLLDDKAAWEPVVAKIRTTMETY